MTETMSFLAGVKEDPETTSSSGELFKALLPVTTPVFIPEWPQDADDQPQPSPAHTPLVTLTTIIIVGCVISSCVLLALFIAVLLRYKRSKVKRIDDDDLKIEKKHQGTDAEIYSEIEIKGRGCCLCMCRRDQYTVSGDPVDNIYAELSDVTPGSETPASKRDVIYETVDGRNWSRSRSKSQGANDVRCDKPPKIYDHLSFQELARLQLENPVPERRKVSSSPDHVCENYDKLDRSPQSSTSRDLDDPDGNNNSMVRRLSQKQIMKKLFVVEREDTRRRRLKSTKRHDYFEVENVSKSSSDGTHDSQESEPAYFVLEDVCQDKLTGGCETPPVPVRTCSLRSSVHGTRCVSVPCASHLVTEDAERRVHSFPDRPIGTPSNTPVKGSTPSVVSSEGVYNLQSGRAHRFSSNGHEDVSAMSPYCGGNEYFELDPVFTSSCGSSLDAGMGDGDTQFEDSRNGKKVRADYFEVEPTVQDVEEPRRRNEYFVVESETDTAHPHRSGFRIMESEMPSSKYRPFNRQISEPIRSRSPGEGVRVVKLRAPGCEEVPFENDHDGIYDRIRFKSVSEKDKTKFRPRLLSTPNKIDF